jgi:hypothetical protein
MTDAVDQRRLAAEALYGAIIEARRDAGDAAVCDALDMLGAGAGQDRYLRAASAIRDLAPGRPAVDDELALRRIMKYPPDRRREAVGIVARHLAPGADAGSKNFKSIRRRLSRKLAKNEVDTPLVLSTSIP